MRPLKYLALSLIVVLCGCGKFFTDDTGGGGGGTGNYLYVANTTGSSIGTFSVATTGVLTTLNNGTPFSVPAAPSAFAASGPLLYVGAQTGAIYAYTINSDGTLTGSGTAVATGLAPTSMAIDSTGSWLLTVDASTGMVSVFQINGATGALATPIQVPLTIGAQNQVPNQVYFTPNNSFVMVALQTGGVNIFTFNSTTGAMTNPLLLAPLNTTQNADTAVRADPLSKFLYVAETGANGVRAFTIASDGNLTQLAGSPFATGLGPAALATDSTGAFLYVANKSANNISGFAITATGTLAALAGSPFTAGISPVSMTLDQTGKFLGVVSSGGGPDLQVYSFDATTQGKLDPVSHANSGTDPVLAVGIVSAK